MTRNVLTIGCSQLVLETQSSKFQTILNQQVETRTNHLAVVTKRLSAKMAELRRLYMDLKSYMGGTCAPYYHPRSWRRHASSSSSSSPSIIDELYLK